MNPNKYTAIFQLRSVELGLYALLGSLDDGKHVDNNDLTGRGRRGNK